uniref:Uncharacterized protein n=1 Tax=Chromera velia CCMP2878 TaxID=1169474 RepID=A0A0G4HCZ8_9ALVE|eukprot:Cvel_6393.t1-p1 / transcript=Cvel_6393.t1 / gene=Cvel_6393 / organism=Chromera_velia_CCMP2878 / gene_product=hypothetical protein / transcript_product=hypothetical protein / location=Cvel_scaffold312:22010-28365(-) / protein_length=868 / sequence_SO=supercontig / SO=protein_coding / is_pseudo=false
MSPTISTYVPMELVNAELDSDPVQEPNSWQYLLHSVRHLVLAFSENVATIVNTSLFFLAEQRTPGSTRMEFVKEFSSFDISSVLDFLRSTSKPFEKSQLYSATTESKFVDETLRQSKFRLLDAPELFALLEALVLRLSDEDPECSFAIRKNDVTHIVYEPELATETKGGETKIQVNPSTSHVCKSTTVPGSGVLFRKDLGHEGLLVESGEKHILTLNLWAVRKKSQGDRILFVRFPSQEQRQEEGAEDRQKEHEEEEATRENHHRLHLTTREQEEKKSNLGQDRPAECPHKSQRQSDTPCSVERGCDFCHNKTEISGSQSPQGLAKERARLDLEYLSREENSYVFTSSDLALFPNSFLSAKLAFEENRARLEGRDLPQLEARRELVRFHGLSERLVLLDMALGDEDRGQQKGGEGEREAIAPGGLLPLHTEKDESEGSLEEGEGGLVDTESDLTMVRAREYWKREEQRGEEAEETGKMHLIVCTSAERSRLVAVMAKGLGFFGYVFCEGWKHYGGGLLGTPSDGIEMSPIWATLGDYENIVGFRHLMSTHRIPMDVSLLCGPLLDALDEENRVELKSVETAETDKQNASDSFLPSVLSSFLPAFFRRKQETTQKPNPMSASLRDELLALDETGGSRIASALLTSPDQKIKEDDGAVCLLYRGSQLPHKIAQQGEEKTDLLSLLAELQTETVQQETEGVQQETEGVQEGTGTADRFEETLEGPPRVFSPQLLFAESANGSTQGCLTQLFSFLGGAESWGLSPVLPQSVVVLPGGNSFLEEGDGRSASSLSHRDAAGKVCFSLEESRRMCERLESCGFLGAVRRRIPSTPFRLPQESVQSSYTFCNESVYLSFSLVEVTGVVDLSEAETS